MATPTTVNLITATFNELVESHNNNALAVPTAGELQPNSLLEFTAVDASPLFTIQLPHFPNFVVNGLEVSIGGAGPYTADYTAGEYQYDQQEWYVNVPGAEPIGAAHPTLNRIDTLVGDNAGVVSLIAGTAAAVPVRPTIANALVIADIYIPSAASGNPPVLATPAFINTPANDGEVIAYSTADQTYLPTPQIVAGTNTLVDSLLGSTTIQSQTGSVQVTTLAAGAAIGLTTAGVGADIILSASNGGDVDIQALNGDVNIAANGSGNNVTISANTLIDILSLLRLTNTNIQLSTTTGTQIGTGATQKLAFFGATPKVRGTALTAKVNNLTQAGFTVEDTTISALTTGGGTYGFANKNEGETVVRALINTMARVAELEARLNSTTGFGLIA